MNTITKTDPRIETLIQNIPKCFKTFARYPDFPQNITFNQFQILDSIKQRKFLSLSDLSEDLKIDKSTTTRIISPLLKKDLISKFKSENDGRSVFVALTDTGSEVLTDCWKILRSAIDLLIQQIPKDKINQIVESLLLLHQTLEYTCDKFCRK